MDALGRASEKTGLWEGREMGPWVMDAFSHNKSQLERMGKTNKMKAASYSASKSLLSNPVLGSSQVPSHQEHDNDLCVL